MLANLNIVRNIRFFFQRIFWGFSDQDTWNLDRSLAIGILPRLKRFKEISPCCPMDLTMEQWHHILDQMIFSLTWFATDITERDESIETYHEVEVGMELFGKYFSRLWW
jgi:hypothetical protein